LDANFSTAQAGALVSTFEELRARRPAPNAADPLAGEGGG